MGIERKVDYATTYHQYVNYDNARSSKKGVTIRISGTIAICQYLHSPITGRTTGEFQKALWHFS